MVYPMKAMTKTEFVRKAFGQKQTERNNRIKKIHNLTDAECFEIETSLKIRKKNYGY